MDGFVMVHFYSRRSSCNRRVNLLGPINVVGGSYDPTDVNPPGRSTNDAYNPAMSYVMGNWSYARTSTR